MTNPIKTHANCPKCGHNGCYSEWADGGSFCHSCGHSNGGKTVDSPGLPPLFYDPLIKESVIKEYRDLDLDVVRLYRTKTGKNVKGEDVRREYVYPSQVKYRYLEKDFSKNHGFENKELFGKDIFPAGSSATITIVEGEDDAPAAYQMLGKSSPVVSLPTSTIRTDLIRDNSEWLLSFKEIVVCTDGDAAGKKAAERLATAFPNRVFLVDLKAYGLNDPQDYLREGKGREFFLAWKNRKKYIPSGYWNTPDQMVEILNAKDSTVFYPTPIEELNMLIHGLPLGHLVVLTGPEGQGKTEVLRMLEYHMLIHNKDVNIGVLHMEETRKTCLETYACYALKKNIRDPSHTMPRAEIDEAIRILSSNHSLYLFDFHIDEEPLSILEKVRYLKEACECKVIFIDPIQQLAYGSRRDQSEEQVLSQISVQLERLANDLNVCIVMTTHVNDDGQTRSSRMIGKSASVRIDLMRDHMNPDHEVRNTTQLRVSKNRPTGSTGFGGTLRFDPSTFTLSEVHL